MSYNAHELSNRLLNALDNDYNVIDMVAVNEIISQLERINITKELLETTRLGKHVNELRRKTNDSNLARRAKVLVKRWRDLVIPTVTSSPAQPSLLNTARPPVDRVVRRLGGTPLTSPALSRVVSPAVPSPLTSRPAWGGYESDSQDVILVDDDPPEDAVKLLPAPTPLTPSKRPLSPTPSSEEKKAKREKKLKKKRGHSRAGDGTEASAWQNHNGSSPTRTRHNGFRTPADAYDAMLNKMPLTGSKKVKTTKELLEEIQSRGSKPVSLPASPGSPDVEIIEPDIPTEKLDSPLRNGDTVTREPTPEPIPRIPLEDEREYFDCTCEEEALEGCPAARHIVVEPLHVRALHNAYLPGVNGTRAPVYPHQFAVRKLQNPDEPQLFNSVVPLYKYSDYADDRCVKNMSEVPLCSHLPWNEFIPDSETSQRLKPEVESEVTKSETKVSESVSEVTRSESEFASQVPEHRTVERTKASDGRSLYEACERVRDSVPFCYEQTSSAPCVTLPEENASETLEQALAGVERSTDEMGRPLPHDSFAEWHECARLGELIALPYVVID